MKKLLVTGISGFLGWNLCNVAKEVWDVTGTFCTHPVSQVGVKCVYVDLTDFTSIKKKFDAVAPDAVIHTAAASSPNYCQQHPLESKIINVDASVFMTELCADKNIPFVFTSTDLVFDGLQSPYREEDPVSPINTYGEQKVLAEDGVLAAYPEAAVCRMPLMFGESSPAYRNFFQQTVDALRQGEELKLFVDEYRTPASGRSAAHGLLLAVDKAKGLVHLGGIERISRYNFGLLMMDVLGVSEAHMVRCEAKDMVMSAPRSPDVSLDSSKAFGLGYRPLSLREELEKLLGQV